MAKANGRGPVNRYYEGRYAPVGDRKHSHRYRAIARGTDEHNKYLVLSACADCGGWVIDDLAPDERTRRALRSARREALAGAGGR